jgi:hypothetical protein
MSILCFIDLFRLIWILSTYGKLVTYFRKIQPAVNSVQAILSGVLGHAKLKDIWQREDRNFGKNWTCLFERELKKLFTGAFLV